MPKYLHQSFYKPAIFGKKLSPNASENRQNGEKLPNLVTLTDPKYWRLFRKSTGFSVTRCMEESLQLFVKNCQICHHRKETLFRPHKVYIKAMFIKVKITYKLVSIGSFSCFLSCFCTTGVCSKYTSPLYIR